MNVWIVYILIPYEGVMCDSIHVASSKEKAEELAEILRQKEVCQFLGKVFIEEKTMDTLSKTWINSQT